MEAKECGSLKKESGTRCIKCCWDVNCEEDLKMSTRFSETEVIGRDGSRFCRGLCHVILF